MMKNRYSTGKYSHKLTQNPKYINLMGRPNFNSNSCDLVVFTLIKYIQSAKYDLKWSCAGSLKS